MTKPEKAAKADAVAQDSTVTIGAESFTLRYGWGAFTAIADALGCTVVNVESRLANMPISALNTVVWAGMLDDRPDLEPETVKAMLNRLSLAEGQAVVKKAGALFRASMPKQEEAKAAAEADPTATGTATG